MVDKKIRRAAKRNDVWYVKYNWTRPRQGLLSAEEYSEWGKAYAENGEMIKGSHSWDPSGFKDPASERIKRAGYHFKMAGGAATYGKDYRAAAKYFTKAAKYYDEIDDHKAAENLRKDAASVRHLVAREKTGIRGLLRKLHIASTVIVLLSGIFFLSPNITGNVIGNNSINSSNLIGAILFFIGLIGLLFTFKRNK